MTTPTPVLHPAVAVPPPFVDEHVAIYRHLHAHPELSRAEHETAAYIEQRLAILGIDSFRCAVTGVVAVIANGDGPVIAFRADTDGLPIAEDTGLPYASTVVVPGRDGSAAVPVMHGCGHDTHITAALGAVQLLLENRDAWHGTLVLVFQPAEEIAAGARAMVDDGLWERVPRPEVVIGQHVTPASAGMVRVRTGAMMSMSDSWRITVQGVQAHGSQPENAVDPIVAAASMVLRLQTVVSREVAPITPVVVTVGTFHAGLKDNIIPASAEFSVNVRTPDEATRAHVLGVIRRIVSAEAAASGAPEPVIETISHAPRCHNDPIATARVVSALRASLGEENVLADVPQIMGSEDVGWLSDSIGVPGVFWFFGAHDPSLFADGARPPGNHSPHFAPHDRSAVVTGVSAALAGILAYLGVASD